MTATIQYDPVRHTEPVLRLLLAASEKWKCTPGEAEVRILEQRARREGFTRPKRPMPPGNRAISTNTAATAGHTTPATGTITF